MKKVFMVVASLLILSIINSCGGDSKGEEALSINYMLDNGDFSGVIDTLEAKETLNAEDNTALGSAYLGRAGIPFSSLITLMVPEEGTTAQKTSHRSSLKTGDESAFAKFIKELKSKLTPTAILDLEKAIGHYVAALVGKTCESDNLSNFEKDICLYQGVVNITKSAAVIGGLSDDITKFGSKELEASDARLSAATCAMLYAYNTNVTNGCSIETQSNVLFTQSQKNYTAVGVKIDDNAPIINLVALNENGETQTIVTSQYCTRESFASRQENPTLDNLPCPLAEQKEVKDIGVLVTLVDVLNNGLDTISAIDFDQEIKDKINEFRSEIANAGSLNVTEEDVIRYLEENN